jgi:mRNA interferase MazF
MNSDFPHQGAIYLSKALKQAGDTKERPVIIVSNDIRNANSRTLLVVPVSSALSTATANPCRVLLPAGEGGLERDSLAMADLITAIKREHLKQGPYGNISQARLRAIQQGIQIAIGVF